MRNGTHTGADMLDYTKQQEMAAYDTLSPDLRRVLREAPFDVSAADMLSNSAVMRAIRDRGADAPTWLAGQLLLTYRSKIMPSAESS